MFIIKNNRITMTKGDTVTMKLDIQEIGGKAYTPKSGDVITLTVRNTASSATNLITKTLTEDGYFVFNNTDTENIPVGIKVYQVEIVNGTVHNTIIPWNQFQILGGA